MSRNIEFSIDEYYHIYNRGVEKRIIFENEDDYSRFIGLLYACNDDNSFNARDRRKGETFTDFVLKELKRNKIIVSIGAYCLMPNHFHLLVKEIKDGGISLFMQKLSTAYTMYFNKKRNRSGVLFDGVFKAQHADSDEYLKYLFSYIHLNPVKLVEPQWKEVGIKSKKRSKDFISSYNYSSYLDYAGQKRIVSKILTPKDFPEYFSSKAGFNSHIQDWLSFDPSRDV
ncbi:MAG: transposase [Patescibacteria group bacterium]